MLPMPGTQPAKESPSRHTTWMGSLAAAAFAYACGGMLARLIMRHVLRVVWSCGLIAGFAQPIVSVAELSSSELKLAGFVLTGMKSGREALQRGEFTAVGSTIEGEPGPGQVKGDLRYHFAFDFSKRSFRYESTIPELIYSPPTAEEKARAEASGGPLVTSRHPSQAIGLQPYSQIAIDTLEADVGWNTRLPQSVTIYPPTQLQGKFEGFFDVRTLGLNMPAGRGMGTAYEELLSAYDKLELIEVRELSKSLVRIGWGISWGKGLPICPRGDQVLPRNAVSEMFDSS